MLMEHSGLKPVFSISPITHPPFGKTEVALRRAQRAGQAAQATRQRIQAPMSVVMQRQRSSSMVTSLRFWSIMRP